MSQVSQQGMAVAPVICCQRCHRYVSRERWLTEDERSARFFCGVEVPKQDAAADADCAKHELDRLRRLEASIDRGGYSVHGDEAHGYSVCGPGLPTFQWNDWMVSLTQHHAEALARAMARVFDAGVEHQRCQLQRLLTPRRP